MIRLQGIKRVASAKMLLNVSVLAFLPSAGVMMGFLDLGAS
jgi:hypothetical protein